MRLGFLGTGTIAEAVVRAARLAAAYGNVSVAGNQGVLDASEVVFLGQTAEQAAGIHEALSEGLGRLAGKA